VPSSDFDRSDNEDDNAEDDDNDDVDEESESDDQTTETPSVNNNLSTTAAATTPTPVASRCQFSQHFKSSFIVKRVFLCLKLELVFEGFRKEKIDAKAAYKILVKLDTV